MKNKHFHYSIIGYRWAPESFQASRRIAGHPARNIPLTFEERHEVGMLYLTRGPKIAIGYVKHIERARERQRTSIISYGFYTKESKKQFVYCPQLHCPVDAAIVERLRLFKKIHSVLAEKGGRTVVSTECDLDGEYRPMNIRENSVTVDFSRPLRISMGEQLIRRGPERPYSPRQDVPGKNRATAPKRRFRRGR